MTSEAPYLHCRLCGARYRSDQVVEHEKQCSYQVSNSRNSSRNVKEELAPLSSKDSGINALRDNEDYYTKAARSSESSVNQLKDPKSNEESIDSPLNLNRGGARVSRENPKEQMKSHSRSESKDWKIPSTDGGSSSGQSNPPSRDNEDYYMQATRSSESSMNQPKDPKSNEKSIDSPPRKSHSRSESIAWEIPGTEEGSSSSGQSNPPTLSSNSGGKSVHHQRSHSNEDTPVKINPQYEIKATPQKSDEEQKAQMIRTPYPSEEDIKIPPINAEEIGEAADILENLPELNEQSEMAYERHKKSLVPCTHCERTFRPDRLPIHERSCIERPKAREYIVPEDNDKKDKN